jgi:hypothetical protein
MDKMKRRRLLRVKTSNRLRQLGAERRKMNMRHTLRILTLLAVAAAPSWAGLEFTTVTKVEGGRGSEMGNMVMNAQAEGDQARMDFVETRNPIFEKGSYMLVNAKGEMTIVNPEKKTYSKVNFAAMMESMGGAMDAMAKAGFKLEFQDPKVEKVLEEPGGEILGYPTTHYRWHTTYTMVMHMPVMGDRKTPVDSVEDVWTTTAIGLPPQTIKAFAGLGEGGQMGAEIKKMIDAAKVKMTGFQLKSVTVSTHQGGRGEGQTTTTTEVTKLQKADIPASRFVVPAGYTETDLMQPQRGPAMPNLDEH